MLSVVGHQRPLLVFASFLQGAAKWLAQHETANGLSLTLEAFLLSRVGRLLHQILLIKLDDLLLDHLLEVVDIMRRCASRLKTCRDVLVLRTVPLARIHHDRFVLARLHCILSSVHAGDVLARGQTTLQVQLLQLPRLHLHLYVLQLF